MDIPSYNGKKVWSSVTRTLQIGEAHNYLMERSLSHSKQTAGSTAAEHQINNNMRLTAKHLRITKISSKEGSKHPKIKACKGERY